MNEATATKLAAALSTTSVALFGVSYYALLYACVGAMLSLIVTPSMGMRRAIATVILSTLAGAALGTELVSYLGTAPQSGLLVACLVGGSGATAFVPLLMHRALGWLKRLEDQS